MKILIGSQALQQHIPLKRTPADTDYFSTEPTTDQETFYHPNLAEYSWENPVATLDELYTIKVSHAFWELKNNSWNKHAFDITLMQSAGAQWIPELHDILYPIWIERYGDKKVNLNTTADLFFNSNVTRKYEHDSIHDSVAYFGKPFFHMILKDNSEVAVDRAKFEALSHSNKYRLVREEVYATALERVLIPSDYQTHYKTAYLWALRKTITSFSKGWFPLFIVHNLKDLVIPDARYDKKHLDNHHLLKLIGES